MVQLAAGFPFPPLSIPCVVRDIVFQRIKLLTLQLYLSTPVHVHSNWYEVTQLHSRTMVEQLSTAHLLSHIVHLVLCPRPWLVYFFKWLQLSRSTVYVPVVSGCTIKQYLVLYTGQGMSPLTLSDVGLRSW